jgi:hypothetical protein
MEALGTLLTLYSSLFTLPPSPFLPSLFTIHCSLLTAHCSPEFGLYLQESELRDSGHYSPFTIHHSLFTIHYSPNTRR